MRYVLIDYMHLVHKYSVVTAPMSYTLPINGVVKTINTTIPACTIKHIVRCGGYGEYKVGVCLDGGSNYRKQYFSNCRKLNDDREAPIEYKGTRKKLYGELREGANLTVSCLVDGGVACYRHSDFEADDFIYTIINKLKRDGVTDPIDVVTNDRDMLPLVDNQVSVYINSKRQFAEIGSPVITGYYQVTPRSMAMYCQYASAYKDYKLPYNSILLFKMIKGDTSDNVPIAVKGYGGKKFTALIDQMISDGVQFENVFRYGKNFKEEIAPILTRYFDETSVARIEEVYGGLNLRDVTEVLGTDLTILPNYISEAKLGNVVGKLNIQLPHKAYSKN